MTKGHSIEANKSCSHSYGLYCGQLVPTSTQRRFGLTVGFRTSLLEGIGQRAGVPTVTRRILRRSCPRPVGRRVSILNLMGASSRRHYPTKFAAFSVSSAPKTLTLSRPFWGCTTRSGQRNWPGFLPHPISSLRRLEMKVPAIRAVDAIEVASQLQSCWTASVRAEVSANHKLAFSVLDRLAIPHSRPERKERTQSIRPHHFRIQKSQKLLHHVEGSAPERPYAFAHTNRLPGLT